MEIAASTYQPSLLPYLSKQPKASEIRSISGSNSEISMSHGFHQGMFGFPDGFDRPIQANQRQQDATIYEPTVVTGGNMLSDVFNFQQSGLSATDLLANQISAGYRALNRPSMLASPIDDWFGAANKESLGLGQLIDVTTKHGHQVMPGLSANSAAAMQLFLLNPQQALQQPIRSSSPPTRTPKSLHSSHDLMTEGASFTGGVVEGQGLSLSLSSSLQQIEMAKPEELRMRDGLLYYNNLQHLQQLQAQGQHQGQPLHVGYGGSMGVTNVLRHSKYARAAQELLEEFCSVGGEHLKGGSRIGKRQNSTNPNTSSSQVGGVGGGVASSSTSKDAPPAVSSSDRFENQRKKAKLLFMLDEVDTRYNLYCEQMRTVVNSFDTVMGIGAATPYTGLAQKAMSRHFRCLKDAISSQLKQTCVLLGERESGIAFGLTKGETPRLKLLDQSLRQQRAFHQMGMMEQEAWRPQRGLPERSVNILRAWLFEHFLHPYPSDADKHLLARQTGLTRNQVSNWFINARVRLWKPMVEEMYLQEAKEEEEREKGEGSHETPKTRAEDQPQQQRQETVGAAENKDLIQLSITKKQHHQQLISSTTSSSENPLGVVSGNVGALAGIELPAMVNYGAGTVGSATHGRFGAPGDVSLTLGLRHAGNMPEKSRYSLRDFTGI